MSEWHRLNKEYVKKHAQQYYQKNKERILARQNKYDLVKVHCELCDCEFRKRNISSHNKSKRHMDMLAFRALKNKAPIFNMFSNIKYVRGYQNESTKD